ncbi:MAG: hypothetical protein M3Y30_14740 [Gemmatimonadota bacterium]|nr:hypothetical protein [Gemmatimonadota bacterium]
MLIAVSLAWLGASLSCGEKAAAVLSRRSVCERGILDERDLQGILRGPIVGSRLVPGDPLSCAFTTGGHSRFEITLRPKHGRAIVKDWIAGTMALEAVPLQGVGDRAAWQRDLHEVIAERGDALCDISVMGTEGDFVDTSEYVLEDRIGNLCNKILGVSP